MSGKLSNGGVMGSNSDINKWVRNAAREVGVDAHELGRMVEEEKEGTDGCNLTYSEILALAYELKRRKK